MNMPPALHWRFEHVGAGELSDQLKAQAAALGIADRCTWHGAQPQKAVFAALARADLFALAAKKAADGDQDGLPNVLMEAAHQGLAIVSTRAAAIGEFISEGDNGLLVAPGAPDELATALAHLVSDPDLRQRLASRANETVRTRFSFESGVEWIASALGQSPFAESMVPEAIVPEARAAEWPTCGCCCTRRSSRRTVRHLRATAKWRAALSVCCAASATRW